VSQKKSEWPGSSFQRSSSSPVVQTNSVWAGALLWMVSASFAVTEEEAAFGPVRLSPLGSLPYIVHNFMCLSSPKVGHWQKKWSVVGGTEFRPDRQESRCASF
jgi:hypothetical protein